MVLVLLTKITELLFENQVAIIESIAASSSPLIIPIGLYLQLLVPIYKFSQRSINRLTFNFVTFAKFSKQFILWQMILFFMITMVTFLLIHLLRVIFFFIPWRLLDIGEYYLPGDIF